jgi:hypothetical protein
MRKIILALVLVTAIYKIDFAQDSCVSRVNFMMQISAGYFYSACTNIPEQIINKPEPLKGLQLNPQIGLNVNWNYLRLGFNVGIVAQKEIRDYGEFIIGPKIQLSAELGSFKHNFPLSFMVYGGSFLQFFGLSEYSAYTPPYSNSFFIGCAPLVRLNKKHSSVSVILGPSFEYFFGITKHSQYSIPGPHKGGIEYDFKYSEITGNILIVLKFQKRNKKSARPRMPFPPFPVP